MVKHWLINVSAWWESIDRVMSEKVWKYHKINTEKIDANSWAVRVTFLNITKGKYLPRNNIRRKKRTLNTPDLINITAVVALACLLNLPPSSWTVGSVRQSAQGQTSWDRHMMKIYYLLFSKLHRFYNREVINIHSHQFLIAFERCPCMNYKSLKEICREDPISGRHMLPPHVRKMTLHAKMLLKGVFSSHQRSNVLYP